MKKIDISGNWKMDSGDLIRLPGTLSYRRSTAKSDRSDYTTLTDPYEFTGEVFFNKKIKLEKVGENEQVFLNLERTRISKVFVDNVPVGSNDSFVAPHVYNLTEFVRGKDRFDLTISVKNMDYRSKGGHMTSPDTQTNWLGILGEMSIYVCDGIYIERITVSSDMENKAALLRVLVNSDGEKECEVKLTSRVLHLKDEFYRYDADDRRLKELAYEAPESPTTDEMMDFITETIPSMAGDFTHKASLKEGINLLDIGFMLGESPYLWSDEDPFIYEITVSLTGYDEEKIYFGFREFKAEGLHLLLNDKRIFLRGKHDGMVFPMTGFAPMNVCGWLYVMKQARDMGINHYRFHTSCPPDAAFIAADLLGIIMEPEIPFWGTFLGKNDEGYDEVRDGQEFLTDEGFAMLSSFSGHPSFCMMSMGNELWGNPDAIDDMISDYKKAYPGILFTQSSNGFQWTPVIKPHDDFFCGVRFAPDRQLRGSYAACDKPFGHVQTLLPGESYDYEKAMFPEFTGDDVKETDGDQYVEIQFGTGVKKVKKSEASGAIIPQVPVITHEVGQYSTFPNLKERGKYTGVLKAGYLDHVEKKLKEKGLYELADKFFECSGKLAADCYKREIESALRTDSFSGFQLLDIQDFPGQDIALVGMLDAFMENKGLITPREFRHFCSDACVLGVFDSYLAGESFFLTVKLFYYRKEKLCGRSVVIRVDRVDAQGAVIQENIFTEKLKIDSEPVRGLNTVGSLTVPLTAEKGQFSYRLTLSVEGTDIVNDYILWSFTADEEDVKKLFADNKDLTDEGRLVILSDDDTETLPITYTTDFWCYPMFRDISISMGREVPVGTMGLLIRDEHPALSGFLTREYTTPQWFEAVMNSRAAVLSLEDPQPVISVIDNFDRSEKLALLYEKISGGQKTLYCTIDLEKLALSGDMPSYYLAKSIFEYLRAGEKN